MTWLCTVLINYALDDTLFSSGFLVLFIYLLFWMQHAGEVYGEKAILATETRELQSRLKSLSEERVKGLAILDEVLLYSSLSPSPLILMYFGVQICSTETNDIIST